MEMRKTGSKEECSVGENDRTGTVQEPIGRTKGERVRIVVLGTGRGTDIIE